MAEEACLHFHFKERLLRRVSCCSSKGLALITFVTDLGKLRWKCYIHPGSPDSFRSFKY